MAVKNITAKDKHRKENKDYVKKKYGKRNFGRE